MHNPNDAQSRLEKSVTLFPKSTFQKSYPDVTDLDVQIIARNTSVNKKETYYYTMANPPGQYCGCPNTRCVGGGWDIGSYLSKLIRERKSSGTTAEACCGNEQMSRSSRRSCTTEYEVTVTLGYATPAAQAPDSPTLNETSGE